MRRLTALILCFALVCCFTGSLAEEEPEYASYVLLDTSELPPELGERKLTDDQIASLTNVEPEQLKKQISTFADYVAWVDTIQSGFSTSITSNPEWQVTLDPQFNFQWLPSMVGPGMVTSIAQFCLSDNIPEIGVVMAVLVSSSGHDFIYANTIPVDGGYLVLCPATYSKTLQSKTNWGMNVIEPLRTEDLTGIITFCQSFDLVWGSGKELSQVLYFDSTEGVVMDWKFPLYVPADDTHVKTLYLNAEAMYPTEPLNLKSYKFPKDIGTSSDLDSATCRALSKGTLQELAEAIRSVPDLLTYMHYAAFSKYDGDLQLPLENLTWHFNYSPEVVFRKNAGNCGATAAFVQYLLQGDYDEVGIIGLTYERGLGGGHVINYIRQKKNYYVLDFNSWTCSNHEPYSLLFSNGTDLKAAAKSYAKKNNGIVLMYSYQTDFGDAPVGWDSTDNSYLIQDYAQNVQILVDDPKDSCQYEFVEEKEDIQQLIRLYQNAW